MPRLSPPRASEPKRREEPTPAPAPRKPAPAPRVAEPAGEDDWNGPMPSFLSVSLGS